jgi:hypothetical protein
VQKSGFIRIVSDRQSPWSTPIKSQAEAASLLCGVFGIDCLQPERRHDASLSASHEQFFFVAQVIITADVQ